jgi:anti-anti-sigma factor
MTDGLSVVELRGLPVDVHRRAEDHSLTLQRELALVHAAKERGTAAERLLWLSEQLSQRYAAFADQPREVLHAAASDRARRVDLRYEVPAHAAEAAVELRAVLDEVDDFCRTGGLLTLVATAEVQAYRRWFLGQFVAQIRDGAAPMPWSPALAGAGNESSGPVRPGPASASGRRAETVAVQEDLDLEGAARIRSALAAILDGGTTDLTIDLAGCEFIDSVGISLLLTTRDRLRHSGGTLAVANVNGRARRTLETSGVYDVLIQGA